MTTATSSPTDLISYEDLYARWEKSNWSAMDIDFSVDAEQWKTEFSDFERKAALWNYALFFYGEDSVADNLSPYIDAAPLEEQKYVLTTQQVDEARHAIFFSRFWNDVIQLGGDTHASRLESTQPLLTWGFKKVFDRLDQMADELRKDRSLPQLAKAITLYHLIVEATLAQPGQHFIEDYLTKRDLLPGFREGMHNIARDEQRHVGFGIKMLHDLVKMDPECKDAIKELLIEILPYAVGVFVPPNWDRRYTEVFGFTIEEIFEFGNRSFETKLRSAGIPIETLGRAYPMGPEMSPDQRTARIMKLLQSGILGEKTGPPSRDPEAVFGMFDSLRTAILSEHPNTPPTSIQWEFTDYEPWHVTIANGSSHAAQGRSKSADVTLRCKYEDWVDIFANRVDARRLIATGRLRPTGSPRKLIQTAKLLA